MVLCIAIRSSGQDKARGTREPKRFKYYFNSGIGYYLPFESSKWLADRGAAYAFNFQCNYRDRYFTHLYFDMAVINYSKENTVVNNVASNFDYKLNANNVGLDIGYTLPMKKVSPYIYAGLGLSFMDTPFIKPGSAANDIVFGTKTNAFFQYRGAIGVDYKISRYFILYLEAMYSSTAFKSVLDDQRLQGVSLILGFKTPL
ncbi:outer membrane protein with beta-barrel domain [Chitinophaga ginsengisoli]|uniref:Outer membrane protein with beta-barrel domain n=1 Tax=Chitinophaga ginsengisoli TaxID=363837 RepID=A0A2P8G4U3_9BACT|nr:outer membrane protein with beta-barrel domain [Chitinophaga ginsengisoli]